jgi:N-acyl-D-aspartate/D-glutamate deacylase
MSISKAPAPRLAGAAAAAVALAAAVAAAAAQPAKRSSDIVISGGSIYEGSFGRPVIGDVAIMGDKIVYVGPAQKNPYRGKRLIEAKGMVVAPGFIDPHTHADDFAMGEGEARLNLPWLMQGVTTIFTGIDGNGQPGSKVDVAGFLGTIERRGFGVNAATYVGFGAVRRSVLGNDARAPSAAELEKMKALVAKGMCEGALGLSAGLFYAPQSFAKTEEVIAVAREAAVRGGIYDTHQRDESTYTIGLLDSTREVIRIGREAGMPVHFAHFKALGVDVHGKAPELIGIVEAARATGQRVTADQYPWEASGTGLEAALLPRWSVDGGRPAMLKRLDDTAQLEKIKVEMGENLRRRGGPGSILLTDRGLPWSAKRLDAVARVWNVDPIDAALRIIRHSAEGSSIVSFNMAESDIKLLMQQPWVVTGSDGSEGHPRMYATFPQKYAKYVLKERTISLLDFINSSTGRTADIFKLDRRGYLRPGYFADLVVFDPRTYRPKADYINPERLAEGVRTLLVNGKVAIDGGKATGDLGGRAIRKTPPAATCRG